MSEPLSRLLQDPLRSGVFAVGPDTRLIVDAARAADCACWRVDIGHIHDKQGFLERLAQALAFPDWFGGNWDALEDCLGDLSWQPASGYVLLLEHAKHFASGHKHEFGAAIDVLDAVADYWRERGKPFWTLVSGPEGWKTELPSLPQQ